MIWIIVWAAFTLFIVWLFARSMRTVMNQQKAWRLFARKHGLIYQKPLWYRAPSLDGIIKGRRVRLYVEETVDPVRRLREFRTTIEVYFPSGGFPTGIAIGSPAYHAMLREIDSVDTVSLPPDLAFSGLLAQARDPETFHEWARPRMDALKDFFSIKHSERLFMGHETDGFMVVQGADTLEDVKDLNARMRMLFALADRLDPLETPAAAPEESPETPAVAETTPQAEESASLSQPDMGEIVTVETKE